MFSFKDDINTMCLTCEHVLNKEKPILHISHDAHDGMWQFLCGDEHELSQCRIVSLKEIFDIDNSINEVSNVLRGIAIGNSLK
jgi:hypothetical protein